MRILFIGTVKFSKDLLEELLSIKANVVGVCTLTKSNFNSDHVDLSPIAKKVNLPVLVNTDLNSNEAIDWISNLHPDVIFCFGWSNILKKRLLNIPSLGVIGFHPSKLPQNRGRHPLIWSIVLGLSETASTFFFIDEGVDSGDIISQKSVPIKPEDNAHQLYKRVTKTAIKQLGEFLPKISSGNYDRIPQNHSLMNIWRKRNISDGLIDWRMSAEAINNLVRGLSYPYVGAHFNIGNKEIKVWKTSIGNENFNNLEPGKILSCDRKGILVQTGYGTILIIEYEPFVNLLEGSYL